MTINIMTEYLENKLLDHILRNTSYTPPTHLYLALYNASPLTLIYDPEIDEGGYARYLLPSFDIAGSDASNSEEISFNIATADWETVNFMGITDSPTPSTGNLLFYGTVTSGSETGISILQNETLRISSGSLIISLSGNENGGWGEATATGVLDFILNNGDFSSPGLSVYMGLGNAIVLNGNYNFLSWLEVSGADYVRKKISGTDWTAPITGSSVNVGNIIFTEAALENWGAITNIVLFNSSSSGDALFWGLLNPGRTMFAGDGIKFISGKIRLVLDTAQTGV